MRFLPFALCLLFSIPKTAFAADEHSLLVLVFEKSAAGPAQGKLGLFGDWIDTSIIKRTTKEAEAFAQRVTEPDMIRLLGENLSCLGLPTGATSCREVIPFTPPTDVSEDRALLEMLASRGVRQALVAKVLLRFTGKTYSSRVVVQEVTIDKSKLKTIRHRGAVYVARVPVQLANQGKGAPEVFDEYWFTGDSPRFMQELYASMSEIKAMLGVVWNEVDTANWPTLPKIDEVANSERFRCDGLACSNVRVLKESSSRTWLVLLSMRSNVVSLDPNAAAVAANMGWLAGAND